MNGRQPAQPEEARATLHLTERQLELCERGMFELAPCLPDEDFVECQALMKFFESLRAVITAARTNLEGSGD